MMFGFVNLKLPFLLLLLVGLASADSCSVGLMNEASLIGVLTLTALFIIAVAFMASQFFRKAEWEAWAKNSGLQVGVAFALVVGINLMIVTGCALSNTLVGQDMFDAPINYLGNLAYGKGFPLVYALIDASLQNQLEALDFTFTQNPLVGGGGEAPHAGEKTKANAQDAITNMLMPMIASLYAQQAIIRVAQELIIPFFIPAAFVLRIFPQTRTMADYLLAISVGLAVVLPLTYVLNMYIAQDISTANIISPSAALDPDLMFAQVASLIPQAVFLPNIAIVITVSFIMTFSKFLSRGFEVEMSHGP